MEFILWCIIYIGFWGWLCSYLARQKNRSTGIAFVMGCILNVIAALYYLAVDPLEKKE